MRTLMLLASIVLIGTGTFCMANAAAAFTSVAFVVGIAFCIVGVAEIIVSKNANIIGTLSNNDLAVGGILLAIIGVAILTGTISDNATVTMLFAFILTRDGIIDLVTGSRDIRDNTRDENIQLLLAVAATVVGIYMFFDTALLNIGTMTLVGIAIIIMGLNRFRLTFDIQYIEQSFNTGVQERLDDARADYKLAMQRAKLAIRESKEAQARMERIKKEIADERTLMDDFKARKTEEESEYSEYDL